MQETQRDEKLLLEDRKRLSMTGVETVDGFGETVLKLTVQKNKVEIKGENIKITSFNKSNGTLLAEGTFNEIRYNYKKPPLIKRIFK